MTRLSPPFIGPKPRSVSVDAANARFIRYSYPNPLYAYDTNLVRNGNITQGVAGYEAGLYTGTRGTLSAVNGTNGNTDPVLNFGAYSLQCQESASSRTQIWTTPVLDLSPYFGSVFKAEAVMVNEASSSHWSSTLARLTFVLGLNQSGAGSPYAASGDPDQTRWIVGSVAPDATTGVSEISANFTISGSQRYGALIMEYTNAPAVPWSWRADRVRLQVRCI